MHLPLSEHMRLLVLITVCGLLWSLESVVPLYQYKKQRFRRALPNIALAALLIFTNLALSFISARFSAFVTNNRIGLFFTLGFSPWIGAVLGVMALDLFAFLAHLILHKSWLGWQFHRVHHSEPEVDVTTTFRQHPGETVWRILWQLLAIIVFGLPLWVVVVYLVLSGLNAQLEHANIKLNDSADRLLRILFVTSNMHKVHHSRHQKETDSNYSNIFSFWDRLFGTYVSKTDFQRLNYGLTGLDDQSKQTLHELLKMPFLT